MYLSDQFPLQLLYHILTAVKTNGKSTEYVYVPTYFMEENAKFHEVFEKMSNFTEMSWMAISYFMEISRKISKFLLENMPTQNH